MKRHSFHILFLAVLANVAFSAEPVASINGRAVSVDEISPPADEAITKKAEVDAGAYDKWLLEYRNEKLGSLIWEPLREEFCKTHDCRATEKEIREMSESVIRSEMEDERQWRREVAQIEKKLRNKKLPEEKRKKLAAQQTMLRENVETMAEMNKDPENLKNQNEVSKPFIEAWKFNRALYREYGGRVIFQQAGIEPLDAYRQFLQEHEKKGAFAIYDPQLSEEFWKYYTTMKHTFLDKDDIDFETPWWKEKDR
jgi:hypothetical protein